MNEILKALKEEQNRKRKFLEEKNLVDGTKKYFKRGELLALEEKEYLEKSGYNNTNGVASSGAAAKDGESSTGDDPKYDIRKLPRSEVIRKLRERGEPILLFGETEKESCYRLHQLEISAPEINRGFRNDFQEAMEQVDEAYLNEILSSNGQEPALGKPKKSNEDYAIDDSVTYESIQEMAVRLGRSGKDHDCHVIMTLIQFLLKMWNDQLSSATAAERMATKGKIARATFEQTRLYLKPLLRKLKNKTIPEDILDSLTDITKSLLKRDYIHASDAYLTMAIGNAPWPIGVTMVGIHARTGREKIFSKNVAHVMNDETQRKYIQGLKRLMTRMQEYFPTDPSRCVEYVSKKDMQD
ncbi:pre-mRNA-splicing factor 18 [Anopheles ziemanni]|uniref:pre-mRNA-splicing factor 18 n=1 Tax=Anopheles coustani TaxID=139045 RepID=UPI00265B21FB|nr:pre-mRNA-splicing factor 18 [Anopheles coustani]XP_058169574.1 pre-mRNA-splicing factor 18 [Anopheles ziemanni]